MTFYNKYKWLMPSLIFSLLLLITRLIFTGNVTFIFLIWNLFLAMLPLYFTHKAEVGGSRIAILSYCCLWLLFFPNAMYITTDLYHLREREEIALWYDLLLLLSFALNGVVLGFLSLITIEKLLGVYVRQQYIGIIIFLLLCLCGYGIYLGRYLRWNSWDIIVEPFSLFVNIFYHVLHPIRNIEVWLLSLLFGLWQYLLYSYIKRLKKVQ